MCASSRALGNAFTSIVEALLTLQCSCSARDCGQPTFSDVVCAMALIRHQKLRSEHWKYLHAGSLDDPRNVEEAACWAVR
eukprot:1147832-Pelagomonas_calceolata.AAC.2